VENQFRPKQRELRGPAGGLLSWARRHEWLIVGVLAILAFGLGVLGILLHPQANAGERASWQDAVYFSIRLFKLDYDLPGSGVDPYAADTWMLQVARVLAPLTVAFALVKGLMLATARWFNLLAISRWKEHAVVCGAGERGRQLACALRGDGWRVVVIEKDENVDTLADVRESGARVIIGSATDPARQKEARLDQAAIVAAVTPCEESNLEVVLAASRRPAGRPLRALAHATRPFAEMFETQPPFDRIEEGREFRFFDHDVAAARRLVGDYSPALVPGLLESMRPARILVAGDGDLLPELLAVITMQCQYAGDSPPAITALVADLDALGRRFPLHHPQLGLVADLRVQAMSLPQLLRLDVETLDSSVRDRPFHLAFVACRKDIDTLSLARTLAQQTGCIAHDVIAGLRPSTQLMRLFVDKQPLAGVQTHDIVVLGCSGDVVLQGSLDQVARRIHESYLEGQLKAGRLPGATPALVPWAQLPEGLRQANRSQADHVPIKRRTLAISSAPDVVEALTVAEHRRWMADRIMAGWRHGAERDDGRRIHPCIRPFEELTEAEKQKDRDTVLAAMHSGGD